jgi:poly-gamma-glutamate synthesis protein (capsule biosynthesis protein)
MNQLFKFLGTIVILVAVTVRWADGATPVLASPPSTKALAQAGDTSRNGPTEAVASSRTSDRKPAAATDGEPPVVRLSFVGDTMLDCLPGKAIAQGKNPFAPFAKIFREADVSVCNLECVVAKGGEPLKGKKYTFRASPACIPMLAGSFSAVNLANNHTGDFGKDAFVEQLGLFKDRLPYFGGGRNLKEAHRPWIVERHGIRIALLGYNEFHPREFEAGENTAGIAWSVDQQVLDDIKAARNTAKADLVIPFMHWGEENEPLPCDRQRQLARKMIDAGADLVVGAHPHVTQTIEYYKGHLIVYSLGNFVFDGFEDDPLAHIGWLLRVTMGKNGLIAWDTVVCRMDDQGLPHPDWKATSPRGDKKGVIDRRLLKSKVK